MSKIKRSGKLLFPQLNQSIGENWQIWLEEGKVVPL